MKKTVKISTSNIVRFFENHPDYKFNDRDLQNIDWITLSVCTPLPESFISRFSSYLNWTYISKYQKLSKDFIIQHMERLDLVKIRNYQYLSKDFRSKYNNLLGFNEFLDEHESNTLYWTVEQKRKLFEGSPYNIQEDHDGEFVFAYKSIRKNNYSIFNNHYLYKKGKIYTSHCDCNIFECNSFGLSGWTKNNAKKYGIYTVHMGNFKIIKLKIYIKNIGAVIKNEDWKIRAKKIEVI